MIVSGITAALDLVTYPPRNLIRPRCAERAKPGRGKPVFIMHIGFLACFHAIVSLWFSSPAWENKDDVIVTEAEP